MRPEIVMMLRRLLPIWGCVTLGYTLLAAGVNLTRGAFWERVAAGEIGALLAAADPWSPALAAAFALWLRERAGARTRGAWRWQLAGLALTLLGLFAVGPLGGGRTGPAAWRAAMNCVLLSAGCFAALALVVVARLSAPPWLLALLYAGFLIGGWLALAALVPFGGADGALIWRWNRRAYLGVLLPSVLLALVLSHETVLLELLALVRRWI